MLNIFELVLSMLKECIYLGLIFNIKYYVVLIYGFYIKISF